MLLFSLLVTVIILWIILYRFRRRKIYKLASAIPRPSRELPIIGVAHLGIGSTESIMTNIQNLGYETMKNGGHTRCWLGNKLLITITDPEDLEVVLRTSLEKDDIHRFIRNILGNGSVVAPVSIWRRRRKILLPIFSPKILNSFIEIFFTNSEILVEKLASTIGTGKFKLWPYLATCTLDTVGEATMGVNFNSQNNSKSPFLVSFSTLQDIISKRISQVWQHPNWLFRLLPVYSKHEKNKTVLHNFTEEVIKKKRDELKGKEDKNNEDSDFTIIEEYQRQKFLDLLISLSGGEKGYTDLELREEILTLTLGATDTTAIAMGYLFVLLAKYPKVQEKVYEELYSIFGDSDRMITKEDLLNLKYLERVIKETLRLYPPVPLIVRKIESELTLPSGHVLPEGSGAFVLIWGCHRDPKYWGPDAEHFDPDRFLPERFNLKHPCSYLPFSNGPRNCVGYQYAMMSMKIITSTILRRYKVVEEPEDGPIPNIKVKFNLMMKDADDYEVALENRRPANT